MNLVSQITNQQRRSSHIHKNRALKSVVRTWVLLVSVFAIAPSAHAVQWKACWKKNYDIINKTNELHRSKGFLEMTIDFTTQTTTLPPVTGVSSTISFMTSYGPCGMTAQNEERLRFIFENQDELKVAMAQGGGEVLTAFASLSGCNSERTSQAFSRAMKSNFHSVFTEDLPLKAQDPYQRTLSIREHVDQVIQRDAELRQYCSAI